MTRRRVRDLLILCSVVTAGSLAALFASGDPIAQADFSQGLSQSMVAGPEVGPNGRYSEVQVGADGTRHLIPLEWVKYGGQPKDGIPSIDAPRFAGASRWDALDYRDLGLVIGVEVDGVQRAYPFQVLVWHEIVNDEINGRPLLITYCPLCGSGIVFEREINGEAVEFGVSGKLYNSNLLMYDRLSETLWSQISGTAVVGELAGAQLEMYPSEIMTWRDWKTAYPDSEVLTRDTGFSRDYDAYAYGDYEVNGIIQFPVRHRDQRLFSKESVTGVQVGDKSFAAFADFDVLRDGPVNYTLDGLALLVAAEPGAGDSIVVFERYARGRELRFHAEDGRLVDEQTGSVWDHSGLALAGELAGSRLTPVVPVKTFWFAWVAFHPETELWPAVEE